MDRGTGFAERIKVSISQRSLVVLGRASNLKFFFTAQAKQLIVASIVEGPSTAPKNRKN